MSLLESKAAVQRERTLSEMDNHEFVDQVTLGEVLEMDDGESRSDEKFGVGHLAYHVTPSPLICCP